MTSATKHSYRLCSLKHGSHTEHCCSSHLQKNISFRASLESWSSRRWHVEIKSVFVRSNMDNTRDISATAICDNWFVKVIGKSLSFRASLSSLTQLRLILDFLSEQLLISPLLFQGTQAFRRLGGRLFLRSFISTTCKVFVSYAIKPINKYHKKTFFLFKTKQL